MTAHEVAAFLLGGVQRLVGRRLAMERAQRVSREPLNDPHRLDDGASVITREDDRYLAALRAECRVTGPWRLLLDYGYYHNDSNLRAYDYNRQLFMAGLEAVH